MAPQCDHFSSKNHTHSAGSTPSFCTPKLLLRIRNIWSHRKLLISNIYLAGWSGNSECQTHPFKGDMFFYPSSQLICSYKDAPNGKTKINLFIRHFLHTVSGNISFGRVCRLMPSNKYRVRSKNIRFKNCLSLYLTVNFKQGFSALQMFCTSNILSNLV